MVLNPDDAGKGGKELKALVTFSVFFVSNGIASTAGSNACGKFWFMKLGRRVVIFGGDGRVIGIKEWEEFFSSNDRRGNGLGGSGELLFLMKKYGDR